MEKLKIEYLPVDDLEPYENNTRRHEDYDVEQIATSIKKYGFDDPIGIWSDHNVIVEGHGRLETAKRLGMAEVPVIRLDHLTDQERREYAIMHNKTAELSNWDFEALDMELEDLDFGDFEVDFGDFSFDNNEANVQEDEFDEELPEEPKTKPGDIYQLGRHRLMCGNSLDINNVKNLMGGAKADMFLTDPPYNVDYTGKTKDMLKIENDKFESDNAFRQFLRDAFSNADSVMKSGAVFYIWHADSEGYNFRGACKDVGWQIRECLVWNKNAFVLGRQDYQWKHEPCLYGWKDGAPHLWTSDRKQATVIDFDRPNVSNLHPTMKPIGLFDYLIRNNTKDRDIVLDLFSGSGTSIMACEQNERVAYGMECDPRYVDVTVERWQEFTGEKAKLIRRT